MIGQNDIVSSLESYTLETLPHSVLLVGDRGCGKHTLVKELAKYYNIDLVDITSKLSYDLISDIELSSTPKMYLIYVSELTEREQNIILKFIEEPSKNNYIMLVADTKRGILETIINRCVEYSFKPYDRETLKTFLSTDNEDVLDFCKTPGQVMIARNNFGDMLNLVDTILTKLKSSRFDNALSITKKFNYKDEYDKFDIDMFFNAMISKSYERVVRLHDNDSLKLYNIVNKYNAMLHDSRINKEILMESMITNMWRSLRHGM